MLKNILKKKIPLVALSIEPATLGIGSMNATTTLPRLIDVNVNFLNATLIFCALFSGLVSFFQNMNQIRFFTKSNLVFD